MPNTVTFDIETCATSAHTERVMSEKWDASTFAPKNNAKDPAIIKRQMEDAEREFEAGRLARVDAGALSARSGRVLCVGLKTNDDPSRTYLELTEPEERRLLHNAWVQIRESGLLVGFGTIVFDIPFVIQRSALLGLTPALPRGGVAPLLRRYAVDKHFDVRAVLCNWDFRTPGTKNDWCQAFQLDAQTVTGADVGHLHRENNHGEIAKHCADDCNQTYAMYTKLAPFYA